MPAELTPTMNAQLERLAALDHAHVWHPFTAMRQWRERNPLIIERAEGFRLIDVNGASYIDGHSSLWCNVHGHRVPEIDDAIRGQLDLVAHATMLGAATVPAIELASLLVEFVNATPPKRPSAPLNKVFFTDAGATATEVAFKMAAGHHFHRGDRERTRFLAVRGGYHGDTVGAMSVGFLKSMHAPFEDLVFTTRHIPGPDARNEAPTVGMESEWPSWDERRMSRAHEASLTALRDVLAESGPTIAALVLEPLLQGAGGIIQQPEGFVSDVADLCREHGVLLIADEVATGLARTGAMLACDHERVRPDILCLAKGLTGGYLPLAATLCTDDIAQSFEGELHENRTLYHGHTYTGNPLGAAAALASMNLLRDRGVVENAATLGRITRQRLRESLSNHPHVGDVRNRGVMTGIELVANRKPWQSFESTKRIGAHICDQALSRGVLIRPLGDVIVLNPAPAMDEDTLHLLLDAVIDTIQSTNFDRIS